MWEAFGRRLRRNYLWIYFILGSSCLDKSYPFPQPASNVAEFIQRGDVGPIPGHFVIMIGIGYYIFLTLVAIGTVGMTKATGEILPRFGTDNDHEQHTDAVPEKGVRAWLYPRHKRRQLLALIITDKTEAVSNRILTDLKRGVTSMQGKGMYTGFDRSVLLCALTVTEVHNLKTAVAKEDPRAFVIVSPAQEILGGGFAPLERK